MGHQLWISPITGYRRKGTRLAELRDLLGAGITARAILEPLQCCPEEAPAIEMASVLQRRDFDVAGVKPVQGEAVTGFVAREELKDGAVKDHAQPITSELLISDSTPLPLLLSELKKREHTFVLIGSEVRGIVTRADLNKPPARVYLFGLISLLEMHLAFWVRVAYPEESWFGELRAARQEKALQLHEERCNRNLETTLLECLQFCDKRDLVLARKELREKLALGGRTAAGRMLTRSEDLRNVIAHSQQYLARDSSWRETIDLVEWVERVVSLSDDYIERRVAEPSIRANDGLWVSA